MPCDLPSSHTESISFITEAHVEKKRKELQLQIQVLQTLVLNLHLEFVAQYQHFQNCTPNLIILAAFLKLQEQLKSSYQKLNQQLYELNDELLELKKANSNILSPLRFHSHVAKQILEVEHASIEAHFKNLEAMKAEAQKLNQSLGEERKSLLNYEQVHQHQDQLKLLLNVRDAYSELLDILTFLCAECKKLIESTNLSELNHTDSIVQTIEALTALTVETREQKAKLDTLSQSYDANLFDPRKFIAIADQIDDFKNKLKYSYLRTKAVRAAFESLKTDLTDYHAIRSKKPELIVSRGAEIFDQSLNLLKKSSASIAKLPAFKDKINLDQPEESLRTLNTMQAKVGANLNAKKPWYCNIPVIGNWLSQKIYESRVKQKQFYKQIIYLSDIAKAMIFFKKDKPDSKKLKDVKKWKDMCFALYEQNEKNFDDETRKELLQLNIDFGSIFLDIPKLKAITYYEKTKAAALENIQTTLKHISDLMKTRPAENSNAKVVPGPTETSFLGHFSPR